MNTGVGLHAYCLSVVLLAVSCGGGGGSSTNENTSEAAANDQPTVNVTSAVNNTPADPIDSVGNINVPSSQGSTAGSSSETGQMTDVPATQAGTETSDTTNADTSTPTEGVEPDTQFTVVAGGLAAAIIAENGPAIGLPGEAVVNLRHLRANASGQYVISGGLRSNTNVSRSAATAVWQGNSQQIQPLLHTGIQVPGLADDRTFGELWALELAADNSIAMIFTTDENSTDYRAAAIADAARTSVVLQSGDTLPGFDGDVVVESRSLGGVTSVSHSSSQSVFTIAARGDNRIYQQWLMHWNGVSFAPIAREWIPADQSGTTSLPTIASGCRINLPVRGTPTVQALDSGEIVFSARLLNPPSQIGCAEESIIHYQDGVYQPLLSTGDKVPGFDSLEFRDPSIVRVLPAGTTIVTASISVPTDTAQFETLGSIWTVRVGETPRLIALEGEEVQIGDTPMRLPDIRFNTSVVVDDSDNVALLVNFDDAQALLTGQIRTSQPHTSLLSPGVSQLSSIASTDSSVLLSDGTSGSLTALGAPSFGSSASVIFRGLVRNPLTGDDIQDTLWRHDASNGLSPIISTGDSLIISGIEQPIQQLPGAPGLQDNSPSLVTEFQNGELIFLARLRSGSLVLTLIQTDF